MNEPVLSASAEANVPTATPPAKPPRRAFVLVGIGIVVVAAGGLAWYVMRQSSAPATVQQSVSPTPAEAMALPDSSTTPDAYTSPTPVPDIHRGEVTFRAAAPLASLDLFPASAEHNPAGDKYFNIGTFTSGPYVGAMFVNAVISFDGPGGPANYRFAVKDGTAAMLQQNSDGWWVDPSQPHPKFTIDGTYAIAELTFPHQFAGPDGKLVFKLDVYNTGDWTEFIGSRSLQQVFTLSQFGPVYTDAPLKAGEKVGNASGFPSPSSNGFYLKAPDGTVRVYEMVIPFVDDKRVPHITWTVGGANTTEYAWKDFGGCGAFNYAAVVSSASVAQSDLVQAGTTSTGDPIWVFTNPDNPYSKQIYDVSYTGTYSAATNTNVKVPYAQFLTSYPLFFWRDAFGRLIKFQNNAFVPQAECGKPVIYLYPQHPEYVSVKIDPVGGLTASDPVYNNGWYVMAQPDGRLFVPATHAEYPYLFWEGRGGLYHRPDRGWVVTRSDVQATLTEKLSAFGLNEQEIADFEAFWVPRMQAAPYYFITFMGTQTMNAIAPLHIRPTPDTVIRVLMDYEPLQAPYEVKGFSIPKPARLGFTVVEWGGVLGR